MRHTAIYALAAFAGAALLLGYGPRTQAQVPGSGPGMNMRYQWVDSRPGQWFRVLDTAQGWVYEVNEPHHQVTVYDPIQGTIDGYPLRQTGQAGQPANPAGQATNPAGRPDAPSLNLSTRESAARLIWRSALANNKDVFRRCVTTRVLERHKDDFDAWFQVWRDEIANAAEEGKTPADLAEEARFSQEDGLWKLDEN